jgi:Flp pilus assembly protein TadG
MRTNRRNQRGQSAIEGVLVTIVLIALFLGILDFGQLMFVHQTLTERARAAARYASIHPDDAAAVQNLALHGSTTAPAGATSGFWGLTSSMVDLARVNQGTNDESVVVTISNYRFQFLSLWIAGTARGKPIVASSPVEL